MNGKVARTLRRVTGFNCKLPRRYFLESPPYPHKPTPPYRQILVEGDNWDDKRDLTVEEGARTSYQEAKRLYYKLTKKEKK